MQGGPRGWGCEGRGLGVRLDDDERSGRGQRPGGMCDLVVGWPDVLHFGSGLVRWCVCTGGDGGADGVGEEDGATGA